MSQLLSRVRCIKWRKSKFVEMHNDSLLENWVPCRGRCRDKHDPCRLILDDVSDQPDALADIIKVWMEGLLILARSSTVKLCLIAVATRWNQIIRCHAV